MSDLLVGAGLVAVSLAVMYAFCIRPMRRSRAGRPPAAQTADPVAEAARRAELDGLRREVAELRAITAANTVHSASKGRRPR